MVAKQFYLENNTIRAKSYADSSLKRYKQHQDENPIYISSYIDAGLCYLLMNDLTNAEGEFQKHFNRADNSGKKEAVRRLEELIRENVNKPDAEYLLRKYYGQLSTELPITQTDSSISRSTKFVKQMMIESFGESSKINTEQDKAYILIHSQIPFLRFDSNRNIYQVNQLSSGDWELWLPAGTHILKISANGFQILELPPMNFGKKRSYEMTIRVDTSTPEP
jgi:hypothetical protein